MTETSAPQAPAAAAAGAPPEVAAPPQPPAAFRWAILAFVSLAMFGCYYVFDALAAATPLLEKELGFSGSDVGLLDTVYNVAALITLFTGVLIIDRLGPQRTAVIFGGIGALGGVLIAFGPTLLPSKPALGMMAGRFVLGVGSELFIVAIATVIGRWFKGKEVSLAMALELFIARQGSTVADKSPDWFSFLFTGWQRPLVFAAALGGTWFLFTLVYGQLESYAAKKYGVKVTGSADKLVPADLVRFGKSYWWVVGLCVCFYATIFPFRSFANLYMTQAHGISEAEAGALKSWLPLISGFGMIAVGLFVDKLGRRAMLMAIGSALLVPPFLLMAYTKLPLELSMGMLGLAFAVVPAVLWPSVTYLVPEQRLGSAFALLTFCQQVFWGAMSWGIGELKVATNASAANPAGWLAPILLLGGLSCMGFVFSFLLWKAERGPRSHGLDLPKPTGIAAAA